MKKLSLLLFALLMWSCGSQVAFTTKKAADVDSVLFYQASDLPDPFLDSLLLTPGDSASLTTILVPPPTPVDSLKQIDGFRVQVFAGLDSIRANQTKKQVALLLKDTVYVVLEKGLFKVQVGDFPYRSTADSIQQRLTISGVSGSWVVSRKIYIPAAAEQPSKIVQTPEPVYKFKIQIAATSDEAKALELSRTLNTRFALPAFYLASGTLFKVYLGRFMERDQAESVLKEVRKTGYPDAWLVY